MSLQSRSSYINCRWEFHGYPLGKICFWYKATKSLVTDQLAAFLPGVVMTQNFHLYFPTLERYKFPHNGIFNVCIL
jgi:hypothetical protein